MESATFVRDLSQIQALVKKFRQQPREGQLVVLEALAIRDDSLNIKLPTGYGKTFTALSVYSILASLGEVNRLLVIFPTDAQLLQFEASAPNSMKKCCIESPHAVCDIRFFGVDAIRRHQRNECQAFAITVQSLIGSRGMDNVGMLLQKGRWMVVVDEYHHYGIDLPFGKAVQALNREFLLCMSATPYRPNDDSAFGAPYIEVSYKDAVKQKAVKPLRGHAYNYRIDAVTQDGELLSFTTSELIAEVGSDNPSQIQKKMIYDRKLRWSPKYISPLITTPLSRMIAERVRTGYKLQAIIGAMCVSHAEMVCEQVRATFPDLVCEWVGTGQDGKDQKENTAIIKKFAPGDGTMPSIDVLVHVGMAGEGLDTVYVSEVIHLNAASVNNSNNQENGRAARYLEGVIGHINFDAGSGYALYVGDKIMDAMDNLPPSDDTEPSDKDSKDSNDDHDIFDLPPEPVVKIVNAECISIDSGDPEVKYMAEQLIKNGLQGFVLNDLQDPDCPLWNAAIAGVKMMRKVEAEQFNETSIIMQLEDSVKNATSTVTGNIIRLLTKQDVRFDKSMVGDIKKRINSRKKRDLGSAERNVESLKQHYNWLTNLNATIKSEGVPQWLR